MSDRCKLIVQMDVASQREVLFNEVYNEEHVPMLLSVPGVISVERLRRQDALTMSLGGKLQSFAFPSEPRFTAVYELESQEVALTRAWRNAVDAGRWPDEIRPYTSNRRHTIHRLL